MSNLVAPHGGKGLVCYLLEGAELDAEIKKAEGLKILAISDRAKGDLIMMGKKAHKKIQSQKGWKRPIA